MQNIQLSGYRAAAPGGSLLCLGSWDSYGVERLCILPGADWEGLEITATFVTPQGSTRVAVPPDGVLPVPPEATARPLPPEQPGRIVFAGYADGVQRITNDLPYLVSAHMPVDGTESQPTPAIWAQYFEKIQGMIDRAVPPQGAPGTVLTATGTATAWVRPTPLYGVGAGLRLDADTNMLSVDTADDVQQDNTRPITSAAVYTAVGNIDALLKTI